MKKSFTGRGAFKFAVVTVVLAFLFACGDDDSSFAPQDENSSIESSDSDDESSSSGKENAKNSSSSRNDNSSGSSSGSSSGIESGSSSSGKNALSSSSTRTAEIVEAEIEVKETCTETGACDAMVKTDVSTWHFVRKDDFGDDAEYTYKASGKDLIVTIKNADGSTSSKTYSMYNMESEAGLEMAFSAAKSTCKDGGGNDIKKKTCVKDTTQALPECNKAREGVVGMMDSTYFICNSGSWKKASLIEYDTYGLTCFDDGRVVHGVVNSENLYVCDAGKFRNATEQEKDTEGMECTEERVVMRGKVNPDNYYYCLSGKIRVADVLTYDTYGLECIEGRIRNGRVHADSMYICRKGVFYRATELEIDTEDLECPSDGRVVNGKVNKEFGYVCDGGSFRRATDVEENFGYMCGTSSEGRTAFDAQGDKYYCTNSNWVNMMYWNSDIPKDARLNPEIHYGEMRDSRDGQVYKTVKIGEHVWMAENLNYADELFKGAASRSEFSFCQDGKKKNCDMLGRLYKDEAAVRDCPDGWHLPDTSEWNSLFDAIGGKEHSFDVLRTQTGWDSLGQSLGYGLDTYGFSALPGGWFATGGSKVGYLASFWGEEVSGGKIHTYEVRISNSYDETPYVHASGGDPHYYVRCVEDYDNGKYVKFTDSRDGQVYKSVKIGDQWWMAENLNYSDSIRTPGLKGKVERCLDTLNQPLEGILYYTWAAAIDSLTLYQTEGLDCGKGKVCTLPPQVQGICPSGWHLPSKSEWELLVNTVGDSTNAGTILKSRKMWFNDGKGVDEYGFNALPAGLNHSPYLCFLQDSQTAFWGSDQGVDNGKAFGVAFGFDYSGIRMFSSAFKEYGYSIRCVKDSD